MELLVVMGVIVVLMVLLVPAFAGILGSRGITSAAYQISGTLEQARTYALANHTYVWVGFTEENAGAAGGTTPAVVLSAADPGGRVIMSVVASSDGTRYSDSKVSSTDPVAFSSSPAAGSTNQVKLFQLGKLIKIDGVHMASLNNGTTASTNIPVRPVMDSQYQVGDPAFAEHSTDATDVSNALTNNPTTFTYPLSGTTKYTFYKAIEFNPQGEASKIVDSIYNGPQPWMEIALQPTHGNAIDPVYQGANSNKAAAVVMVEGITGRIQILRP